MITVDLNPGFYGLLRSSFGESGNLTVDISNIRSGLWTISLGVWTASSGALDFASVTPIVHATDPTGVVRDNMFTGVGLGAGPSPGQESRPILYQGGGVFSVEFQYSIGVGTPTYGYVITGINPYGAY